MALRCGIVGLPNVGKSTLFNALSNAGAESANYPFCTIEPNVGIVTVQDERLDRLAQISDSVKVIPTAIEFVDIAGLVAGASKGEGLGNQFLSHIREVDAIVHVIRCFDDENITHVAGSVDPQRDVGIIDTELLLKDVDTMEKRIEKGLKATKTGDKKAKEEVAFYERLNEHLNEGKPARSFSVRSDEEAWMRSLFLLTSKPLLYAANVSETDLAEGNSYVDSLRELAEKENTEVILVSAEMEAQLIELDEEEREEFMADLGVTETGLSRLVKAAYKLLGLITFFTTGPKESRAWTIKRGFKAPQAAGTIHTDFERGFIRAETIKYNDFDRLGSEVAVKEAGLMRSEGKEYVMEDGDVVLFRFNV